MHTQTPPYSPSASSIYHLQHKNSFTFWTFVALIWHLYLNKIWAYSASTLPFAFVETFKNTIIIINKKKYYHLPSLSFTLFVMVFSFFVSSFTIPFYHIWVFIILQKRQWEKRKSMCIKFIGYYLLLKTLTCTQMIVIVKKKNNILSVCLSLSVRRVNKKSSLGYHIIIYSEVFLEFFISIIFAC